jgi:hypothetical protein
MSVTKYIDIDSTYRNRLQYPDVGDFVMTVNDSLGNVDGFNARDPVCLSFPYDTGELQTDAVTETFTIYAQTFTFLKLKLSAGARDQENFYINSYIDFPYYDTRFWLILSYNQSTKDTLCCKYNGDIFNLPGGPYPTATGVNGNYFIRYQLPVSFATDVFSDVFPLYPGGTTQQVKLGGLADTVNSKYVGMFLFATPLTTTIYPYYIDTPFFAYQHTLITEYAGLTKIAKVRTPLLAPQTAGNRYYICPFSYDNARSLQYYGTDIFNNPRCVNLSLSGLVIPAFLPLMNTNAGYITDYPYVWVSVTSTNGTSFAQPIVSAAPVSREALFKCSILNSTPQKYYMLSPSISSHQINFKWNDNIRIKILLPNGQPIKFNPVYFAFFQAQYTFFPGLNFPVPPDPRLQVQCTLNVTIPSS